MIVEVCFESGTVRSVELSSAHKSVNDLKEAIYEESDIAPTQQLLFFGGILLDEDESSLFEHKISSGSRVYVALHHNRYLTDTETITRARLIDDSIAFNQDCGKPHLHIGRSELVFSSTEVEKHDVVDLDPMKAVVEDEGSSESQKCSSSDLEQEENTVVNYSEGSVSLNVEEIPDPRFAIYVDEKVQVTDIAQTDVAATSGFPDTTNSSPSRLHDGRQHPFPDEILEAQSRYTRHVRKTKNLNDSENVSKEASREALWLETSHQRILLCRILLAFECVIRITAGMSYSIYLTFLAAVPLTCFMATTTLNLFILRFGVIYFLMSSLVSLPIIFIFNDPSWFEILLFTFVSFFQLFAAVQMKALQSIIANATPVELDLLQNGSDPKEALSNLAWNLRVRRLMNKDSVLKKPRHISKV